MYIFSLNNTALYIIFQERIDSVSKMNFDTAPFSCVRIHKVQGTETEAERSVPKHVTEVECCKQCSHLRMMTHCSSIIADHPNDRNGLKNHTTRLILRSSCRNPSTLSTSSYTIRTRAS